MPSGALRRIILSIEFDEQAIICGMYNRPIQSFLEHALFAFASSTLSMTPIADIFARIIADVDRLHNRRFNEVELVRSRTRRIHRRLDLINVGADGPM